MEKETLKFDIQDSKWMYGVAILMLVFHHLYCDPQRLHYDYFTIMSDRICVKIGIFCHLCVAVYSYITGYGFSSKFECVESDGIKRFIILYKIILKSLLRFMIKYWIVLAVFLPIGIVLGKIELEPFTFIKSIVGMSNVYNNEWWYVKQYVKVLMLLPLFDFIYMGFKKCIENKQILSFLMIWMGGGC